MANGEFLGSGTLESPYLIEDAFDFNAIRAYAMGGFYFKLIKDINMDVTPFNTGGGYDPITEFNGFIDGDGHVIYNYMCKPVVGGRQDTGFILKYDGRYSWFRNLHFKDINIETSSTGQFNFFGISVFVQNATYFSSFYSIQGIIKYEGGSSITDGIIAREIINSGSTGGTTHQANLSFYLNIDSIGSKELPIIGRIQSNRASDKISVTKIHGFISTTNSNYISLCSTNILTNMVSSIYFIDSPVINNSNNTASCVDTSYLTSVQASYPSSPDLPIGLDGQASNDRLCWEFPGNDQHLIPKDIKRSKHLIGFNNQIYTYNKTDGLVLVGTYPVTGGMILNQGFDYIESIPPNIWQDIKDQYGNVDVFKHLQSVPAKVPASSTTNLVYKQDLEDKALLEGTIDFNANNNDIVNIKLI